VDDLCSEHTDASLSDNKHFFPDARINTPAAMHRDTRDAEEGGFAWVKVLWQFEQESIFWNSEPFDMIHTGIDEVANLKLRYVRSRFNDSAYVLVSIGGWQPAIRG
jgi:hypothetical protein